MKTIRFTHLLLTICTFAACTPHADIPPTATITSTYTPSMMPSLTPSVTSTPTLAITWTPLPTLSDFKAEAQLLEWLQGTQDCRLPCWAGITPGVTTWEEAKQILGRVVISSHLTVWSHR
ncbi:MAG: hypothetical protein AB1531_09970 [Chloroflexota bacterium]